MNDIKERYLPIGTVVQIDDSDIKLMIVGYGGKDSMDDSKYDYIGFPYPSGFLSTKTTALFNKDSIGKVLFEGYKDEKYDKMLETAQRLSEEG